MSEELERIVEAHFSAADTRQIIRDEIRAVFAERDEAERLMTALIGPVRAHDEHVADLDAPLLGLPGPPLNG